MCFCCVSHLRLVCSTHAASDKAKAKALTALRTSIPQLHQAVDTLGAVVEDQVEAVFASSVKQVGLHKEQLETMLEWVGWMAGRTQQQQ